MNNCPFCRIAAAEPGNASILENESAVAFLDIRPIRPGHVLIVPRRHEPDFWSLTAQEQQDIMALARQVAEAQRTLFSPVKVGLLVAGFEVPHAHVHVAPLHGIHDLTSEAILNGTIQFAPADDLAELKRRYAEHFASAA